MIMRRLGKRTGTAQRRNGDTLRKPPHWRSGRAAGEADGVPLVRRSGRPAGEAEWTCRWWGGRRPGGRGQGVPRAHKERSPDVIRRRGSPKYGGDLLSQLVCQYHRRARA